MKKRKRATRVSRPPRRPVSSLRPGDFETNPIWRFVTGDEPDETWVMPLATRRVSSLAGKVLGTEVTLADGTRHGAMFGNVSPENPELTEHFLSVSLFVNRKWFHLARYHDFDARTRGPRALAAALKRPVNKVFPIRYDLRPYFRKPPSWLEGAILQEPRQRLTRAEVMGLAVPKAADV